MAFASFGVTQHGAAPNLGDLRTVLALTTRLVLFRAGPLLARPLVPGAVLPWSVVARTLIARPVVTWSIVSGSIVSGSIVSGPIIASARASVAFPPAITSTTVIPGSIIAGSVVPGTVIARPVVPRPVIPGPIIARALVARSIVSGPIVSGPIIARSVITRLPLAARPLLGVGRELAGLAIVCFWFALRLTALVLEVDVVARRELVSAQDLAGRAARLNRPQQAEIVFGVLQIVLAQHTVSGRVRVARELLVFLENELRIAAHLDPFGAVGIEGAVGVLCRLAASATITATAAVAPTLALHTFEISHILETVRLFPERLDRRFALSRFGPWPGRSC